MPELMSVQDDLVLIGVGSLLKADVNRIAGRKVVFGAGSGYGNPPVAEAVKEWDIYAVRGPLTAQNFGLDPSLAITDSAWIINQLDEYAEIGGYKQDGVLFIPHWTSAEFGNWKPICDMAGVEFVNPLDDCHTVLNKIANARLTITESLHGAIFSDYFRTPWVPVSSPRRVLHYKWVDWCQSLDMPYKTLPLPFSDWCDFLTAGMQPTRSMPELTEKTYQPSDFSFNFVSGELKNGFGYRVKQQLKGHARGIRDGLLGFARRHRDMPGVASWNNGHREAVAAYLERIAQHEGYLSNPAVREQRIDQLNTALDKLKQTYGAVAA